MKSRYKDELDQVIKASFVEAALCGQAVMDVLHKNLILFMNKERAKDLINQVHLITPEQAQRENQK